MGQVSNQEKGYLKLIGSHGILAVLSPTPHWVSQLALQDWVPGAGSRAILVHILGTCMSGPTYLEVA